MATESRRENNGWYCMLQSLWISIQKVRSSKLALCSLGLIVVVVSVKGLNVVQGGHWRTSVSLVQ